MGSEGESIPRVNLMRPAGNNKLTAQDFQKSYWRVVASLDEFTIAWNQEVQAIPEFTYSTFYLITGLLLPIWKKLDPTQMRVYRLQTDDGEQLLGRVVESGAMTKFTSQFNVSCQITDWEVFQAVHQEKQTIS